jgi:hypothetical protein
VSLADCELHGSENKHTVSGTLRRAAAWMTEQGCGPVQAVMSDNALCYARSDEFRDTLTDLGARHILIPPRTPRWKGKICVLAWSGRPAGRRGSPRPRAVTLHPLL